MCEYCETTETPQWRSGPFGIPLCNACGIKWSRAKNNNNDNNEKSYKRQKNKKATNNKSSKRKRNASKNSKKSTTASALKQKASPTTTTTTTPSVAAENTKDTTLTICILPDRAGAFVVKPTETSKATTQERTLQTTTVETACQHSEKEKNMERNSVRTKAPHFTLEKGDTETSIRLKLNGAAASALKKAPKVAPIPKPSTIKRSKPPTRAKRNRDDDDDLDYEEVHSDEVVRSRSTRTRRAPKRFNDEDHESEGLY